MLKVLRSGIITSHLRPRVAALRSLQKMQIISFCVIITEMITNIFHVLISQPLYNCFVFLINVFPYLDAGVIVIIFTIIVKIFLLPLSIKASKAQIEMKSAEKDLALIKEKYKDNKEEQSKQTIEYYKQKGINPFAGIFVLLIQLPIIIGLYRVFLTSGLPKTGPDRIARTRDDASNRRLSGAGGGGRSRRWSRPGSRCRPGGPLAALAVGDLQAVDAQAAGVADAEIQLHVGSDEDAVDAVVVIDAAEAVGAASSRAVRLADAVLIGEDEDVGDWKTSPCNWGRPGPWRRRCRAAPGFLATGRRRAIYPFALSLGVFQDEDAVALGPGRRMWWRVWR